MKQTSKLMRASGILLALTLMTSCFVGGTFAKYVTEDDATDTARVAMWGVEVTAKEGKTFSATDNGDTTSYGGTVVQSSNGTDKIVAPGTQGSFGGITVTGDPEVAVKVETTAIVDLGGDEAWTVIDGMEEKVYCPLIFKVGNEVIDGLDYSTGGDYGSISNLEDAIESAIYTQYSTANDDPIAPGEELDIDVAYEWAWLFNSETEDKTWSTGNKEKIAHKNGNTQSDELDTLLGDEAAKYNFYNFSIEVTTTVTQVD